MLGRKTYTKEELDRAKKVVSQQLRAHTNLARAVDATGDAKAAAALAAFEPVAFDNLILALDRYFVHRLRMVTGKDTAPLNELELLTESLMNNDGVFRGNNVIRYVPDEDVLGLQVGGRIQLSANDFDRLASAVLANIEEGFVNQVEE